MKPPGRRLTPSAGHEGAEEETDHDRHSPVPVDGTGLDVEAAQRHRRRRGGILMLLLLGPAPIALIPAVLGTDVLGTAVVSSAGTVLAATALWLYRLQRRDAALAGLPLLPPWQASAFLAVVVGIALGAALLPHPVLAPVGLVSIGLTITVIYLVGRKLGVDNKDLDERNVILLLALMACLIALGGTCA